MFNKNKKPKSDKLFIGCKKEEVEAWKQHAQELGYEFVGVQSTPPITGGAFPDTMLKFQRLPLPKDPVDIPSPTQPA